MSELGFEDYLHNLKQHPDAGVRANAAWQLGRTRDHRCLQALLAAADDPSPAVRARVMEALGSRRDAQVIPAIERGLYDADDDVRAMAARAAALLAATALTPRLFELLDDASFRVVEEAVQALAYSEDDAVGPRLVRLLLAQADSDTLRYFVRQALMRRGGEETLHALLALFSTAAVPLAVLGDALEVLAHMRDERARLALAALCEHQDDALRETARWALGQL